MFDANRKEMKKDFTLFLFYKSISNWLSFCSSIVVFGTTRR